MYDVAVIGAGPAGSTIARLLAQAGFLVLLLEKKQLPRYKACGGGLTAKTARLLPEGWQQLAEDAIKEISFSYHYHPPARVRQEYPFIFMVMRDRFDYWLAQQARAAGAELLENCAALRIREDAENVSLVTSDRVLQARFAVGADGCHSMVRRSIALKLDYGLALESEIPQTEEDLAKLRGQVRLIYGILPGGYGWLFPKKSLLSAGIGSFRPHLSDIKEHWLEFARRTGAIREGSEAGTPALLKAHPLSHLPRPNQALHGKSSLVIGDAAGLIDPFTGEGIYYALKSAGLAADVLAGALTKRGHGLHHYTELVGKEILPDLGQAARIARAIYSLPALVDRLVRSHQEVLDSLAEVISGGQNYTRLLAHLVKRYSIFRHT